MKTKLLQLFLSDKQLRKLTVLKLLYQERRLTLSRLAALMSTSLRTTKNLINELTTELLAKFPAATLTYENNCYLFHPALSPERFYYLTEQLEQDFFTGSPTLMVFKELFELRRVSLNSLAEKINYSTSHTYHLIKKIKLFLKYSHYDISIVEHDYNVAITGSELEIRLLHYYSYVNVFPPAVWPFQSPTESQLQYSVHEKYAMLSTHSSPATIHRLAIFLATWQIAYSHQQSLGPAAPALAQLDNYLCDIISFLSANDFCSEPRLRPKEVPFYHFLILFLFPVLLSPEQKLNLGHAFLTHRRDNIYLVKAAHLLQRLPITHMPATETQAGLMYDIVVFSVLFKELQLWKFIDFNFYPDAQSIHHSALQTLIEQTYNEMMNKQQIEAFGCCLGQNLFSYNLDPAVNTLYVYTGFYHQPELKPVLDRTLMIIYTKQSISLVNDIRLADVIISDVTHALPDKNHFLLNDINNTKVWEELGKFIQAQIQQKWSLSFSAAQKNEEQ